MKTQVLIILALFIALQISAKDFHANEASQNQVSLINDTTIKPPGIAVYAELLGKGFFSFNVDFPINFNNRFSFGLTALDYEIEEYENFSVGEEGILTAGVMYYYLSGKKRSFLELGVGFSLFHHLGVDYHNDSPLTLHGVIGYRYQKQDGIIFRAGFTPFLRINAVFLPLIGLSVGYSW